MLDLEVSRAFALPAHALWPLVGRFSRLPEWFPGIDDFSCTGDSPGATRQIHIGPFRVTQALLAQDDTGLRTVYQVTDGSGITPATGFVVTIWLVPDTARGCRLHWRAELAALPSLLPTGSEAAFIARTRGNYESALDHLEQVLARRNEE
ncbi:MAG: SRPBCC family protein [Moraxellaceae bacterium]